MLVVTDVAAEPPVRGDLFRGKRFWIAQRCPARRDFIKRVTYNGGDVVQLEKHADYIIVDHARKDLPAGGVSYRFIEQSIRAGELQQVDAHICGPPVGVVRDVGSLRPARAGRVPFSTRDEIELNDWVNACEARGVKIMGNEIYKDLERKNPRHTWQSWRDHYLRQLSVKPPLAVASPPSDPQHAPTPRKSEDGARPAAKEPARLQIRPSPKGKQRRTSPSPTPNPSDTLQHEEPASISDKFTLQDYYDLVGVAEDINNIPISKYGSAWARWTKEHPEHSAREWRAFFEDTVLPVFQDFEIDKRLAVAHDQAMDRWVGENGTGASIKSWLDYYRNEVFPSIGNLIQSVEIKQEAGDMQSESGSQRPGSQRWADAASGKESSPTRVDGAAPAQPAEPEATRPTTNSPPSREKTPPAVLGKRSRDADDAETHVSEAPLPSLKRPHVSQVPSDMVQESVEVTPTKNSDSARLPASQVVSISSSVPPSLPLSPDIFREETPETRENDYQGYEEEERDDETVLSVPIERVRQVLDGLSDEHVDKLLRVLKTMPTVPDQTDDMSRQEAVVMYTVHFLKQINKAESQAIWDVGDELEALGLMEKLVGEDDESQDYEEDAPEQAFELRHEESEPTDQHQEAAAENPSQQNEIAPSPHQSRSPTPRANATSRPSAVSFSTTPRRTNSRSSQAQKQTTSTSAITDLTTEAEAEAYITSRLKPPYAFAEADILTAMHATCAHSTALADTVLRWMRTNAGDGGRKGRRSSINVSTAKLPDMRGVWTGEDDRALVGGNVGEKRWVERKHGRDGCRQRRLFLQEL